MDGWGDAESRTWLAMDLLAPVHELWALEVVPGPGGEAPPAVQALTAGLLGEHRPELTEAALAGLVDLERALVVGAALEVARGLVAPEVLIAVECALVDEACRLSLLPLVNAVADLLLELERDAVQGEVARDERARNEAARNEAARNEAARNEAARNEAARNEAARNEAARNEAARNGAAEEAGEPEPVQRALDGSRRLVGSADPPVVGDLAGAAADAGCAERPEGRVEAQVVRARGSARRGRDRRRGPARGPVVAPRVTRGERRSRAPPPGRGCSRR